MNNLAQEWLANTENGCFKTFLIAFKRFPELIERILDLILLVSESELVNVLTITLKSSFSGPAEYLDFINCIFLPILNKPQVVQHVCLLFLNNKVTIKLNF
jgi:hypothetical protein